MRQITEWNGFNRLIIDGSVDRRKAGSLGKQEKEDSSNAWEAGEYYLGQYDDFSNSKPPEKQSRFLRA